MTASAAFAGTKGSQTIGISFPCIGQFLSFPGKPYVHGLLQVNLSPDFLEQGIVQGIGPPMVFFLGSTSIPRVIEYQIPTTLSGVMLPSRLSCPGIGKHNLLGMATEIENVMGLK